MPIFNHFSTNINTSRSNFEIYKEYSFQMREFMKMDHKKDTQWR
jgi:hypothetical protein